MCDRHRAGIPRQYFTEPPRPTQPPTLSGREMSTGQSAVTLCGRGIKAGWLTGIPYVDKRGWQVNLCDPSLIRANPSTLEMSITHSSVLCPVYLLTTPSLTVFWVNIGPFPPFFQESKLWGTCGILGKWHRLGALLVTQPAMSKH